MTMGLGRAQKQEYAEAILCRVVVTQVPMPPMHHAKP
jgi:hypothetical protein